MIQFFGMYSVVKHGEGGGKLTNDVGRSPESFMFNEKMQQKRGCYYFTSQILF